MKKRAILLGIVVTLAAFLSACGDDITNNVTTISGVQTVADLDISTTCTEGELILNLADSKLYECGADNHWIVAMNETASSAMLSSSSERRNDSVRVDTVYIDTSAKMAIVDKTISGVSQKGGPFLAGSSVVVRELAGKSFSQTGKSFLSSISNDRGEFTFHNVTLASRYAILQANGYYQRISLGTSGPSTLNALVDFANRETVNINILTHLEFQRVLNLIDGKMTYAKAKKQAEEEILREFGIVGDFPLPEDLNIFSTGDGDAVLLAISVIIQGSLSDSEFSERLALFANDFADNGKLDEMYSRIAKIKMADWVNYDAKTWYTTIRENFLRLNGGNPVAAFEPLVDRYLGVALGFGMCTSENNGAIAQDTNWIFKRDTVPILSYSASSTYGNFFICDSMSGTWVPFANPDSTRKWTAEADGALKTGDVTGLLYKYDELRPMWVLANPLDSSLGLNGCTKTRDGSFARGVDDACYLCRAGSWQSASALQCN